MPSYSEVMGRVEPVFETIPGWQQDVTQATSMSDLPAGAHLFLDRVSELVGCPVEIVSIGPGREQTIFAEGAVT